LLLDDRAFGSQHDTAAIFSIQITCQPLQSRISCLVRLTMHAGADEAGCRHTADLD
jgi:hypothetical protein